MHILTSILSENSILNLRLIWTKRIFFFFNQISTVQYCLKLQNIIALLIKSIIFNNHRTSSSRKKSNILYVLKFSLKFKKKKNSNDITERCIVGYKYSIMGYISIYRNKDFSSLKNDLFVFQLA